MTYLLDVNALVALGFQEHEFHPRMARWVNSSESPFMATCSITEIGFVRILSNSAPYAIRIDDAKAILRALKVSMSGRLEFIADGIEATALPRWVSGPRQITDGHLLTVAASHSMQLATFDSRIPGASVIP